jgi:hypothetical protein
MQTSNVCPRPFTSDDGTQSQCVERGHCGCSAAVCDHKQLARSCEICERDAEIHKLKTQHAYEANGLRALLQNERDNMNAALLEIDRLKTVIGEMTINQRIQDSITAQVMERAEKAEAEAEVFKSLYLNEQGRCEALRVDVARGTAAWKDVQNASKWVDELRGGSDTAMGK